MRLMLLLCGTPLILLLWCRSRNGAKRQRRYGGQRGGRDGRLRGVTKNAECELGDGRGERDGRAVGMSSAGDCGGGSGDLSGGCGGGCGRLTD